MLSSAVQVVAEGGYGQMSVARVTGRAGVSRRTFYDLFDNREACFLAAFDDAVAEMGALVATAVESERQWRGGIRAALEALLGYLDERPDVALLVIVEALAAGPRVLEHRARVLARVSAAVDEGRRQAASRPSPPPLTAEGIVGAVFSLIHTRVVERSPGGLIRLLNPLMAMIVAPYLGQAVASRELDLPAPGIAKAPVKTADPLLGLHMRITYRTFLVLRVIGEQPGASNRQVSVAADVADQGQISKLLARLEGLGLIVNDGREQPTGEPNAWSLTPRGEEVQRAIASRSTRKDRQLNGIGEGL
jgi:AcrR family transcriptional regulator